MKCRKPMWSGFGLPAGFCDEPAFGPSHKDSNTPCLLWACLCHGGPKEDGTYMRGYDWDLPRWQRR